MRIKSTHKNAFDQKFIIASYNFHIPFNFFLFLCCAFDGCIYLRVNLIPFAFCWLSILREWCEECVCNKQLNRDDKIVNIKISYTNNQMKHDSIVRIFQIPHKCNLNKRLQFNMRTLLFGMPNDSWTSTKRKLIEQFFFPSIHKHTIIKSSHKQIGGSCVLLFIYNRSPYHTHTHTLSLDACFYFLC